MSGERSALPPRLRDWTKGKPQIGAFLRTREGSTITLVNDAASDDQEAFVLALIMGLGKMPLETRAAVRAWVDSRIKPEGTS